MIPSYCTSTTEHLCTVDWNNLQNRKMVRNRTKNNKNKNNIIIFGDLKFACKSKRKVNFQNSYDMGDVVLIQTNNLL